MDDVPGEESKSQAAGLIAAVREVHVQPIANEVAAALARSMASLPEFLRRLDAAQHEWMKSYYYDIVAAVLAPGATSSSKRSLAGEGRRSRGALRQHVRRAPRISFIVCKEREFDAVYIFLACNFRLCFTSMQRSVEFVDSHEHTAKKTLLRASLCHDLRPPRGHDRRFLTVVTFT